MSAAAAVIILGVLVSPPAQAQESDAPPPDAESPSTDDDAPEAETEGDAAPPPRRYDLTAGDTDALAAPLGSALERIGAAAAEEAAVSEGALDTLLGESFPSALQREAPMLRGHVWFRPLLAVGGVRLAEARQSALLLGGAVGHRWWSLSERPVIPGGETRLELLAPVSDTTQGATGTLSSLVGPWIGPVGIQVGPLVRAERSTWTTASVVLPDALLVGGRASLSLDVGGRVQLYGGHERAWVLAGARDWSVEPSWLGGAAVRTGWLQLRGQATGRLAGDAQTWSVGMGIHLLPQINPSS